MGEMWRVGELRRMGGLGHVEGWGVGRPRISRGRAGGGEDGGPGLGEPAGDGLPEASLLAWVRRALDEGRRAVPDGSAESGSAELAGDEGNGEVAFRPVTG